MKETLENISKEYLLSHGIDPESVGWLTRITSKDISETDKEKRFPNITNKGVVYKPKENIK